MIEQAAWRPAGTGLAAGLLSRGGASREAVKAAEAELGVSLPRSLAEFVQQADAAEGWVGGTYLAMWPVPQLAEFNRAAQVAESAPELVALATDGGLEGYFFDRERGEFFNSPMIGLGYVRPQKVGRTFDELLGWLAKSNRVKGPAPVADPSRFGLVIHEITPVIFGGSPTDPQNKTLLPLATYAKAVAFWNEQLRAATSGRG
jgi:hypothetical protein